MAFKNHFLSENNIHPPFSKKLIRHGGPKKENTGQMTLHRVLPCLIFRSTLQCAISNFQETPPRAFSITVPWLGLLSFTDFVFASFNFYLTVLVKYSLWTTKVQYFWWKTSCTIWNVYFPSINSMIWFWRLPFLDFYCLSVDPPTFLFSSADISRWCFKKPPTLYTIWPIWGSGEKRQIFAKKQATTHA